MLTYIGTRVLQLIPLLLALSMIMGGNAKSGNRG